MSCTLQSPPLQARVLWLVQGDVKEQLCDFAEEHAVDLLVVAASSHVGFKKAFGTSTSSHLAHHAPCPTLVLPWHIASPGSDLAAIPSEQFDARGGCICWASVWSMGMCGSVAVQTHCSNI